MIVEERNGRFYVVEADGFKLEGNCKRTGQCCAALKCEYLTYEIMNGKKVARCILHEANWKPAWCTLWPRDPKEPLYKGCGYKWVK